MHSCPRSCPRSCPLGVPRSSVPRRCPLCDEAVDTRAVLEHAREKSHRVLQLPAIIRLVAGVPWRLSCLATRSDGTVLCIDDVRLESQVLKLSYRPYTAITLEVAVSIGGSVWQAVVPGERLRGCSYWLRLT